MRLLPFYPANFQSAFNALHLPLVLSFARRRIPATPFASLFARPRASQKGIAPHVDLPHRYGSPILSLSLLSGTTFLLRRRRRPPASLSTAETTSVDPLAAVESASTAAAAPSASEPDAWETHRFYLPARSVLVLDGEARYGWEHGIEPVLADLVAGRGPSIPAAPTVATPMPSPTITATAAALAMGENISSSEEPHEDKDGDGHKEWRLRGTRVSLTLRWMLEGGDVVGCDRGYRGDSGDGGDGGESVGGGSRQDGE